MIFYKSMVAPPGTNFQLESQRKPKKTRVLFCTGIIFYLGAF